MFAMLARKNGEWKIVCISVPSQSSQRSARVLPCEIMDRLTSSGIAYDENLLRLPAIFSRCRWDDAMGNSRACCRARSEDSHRHPDVFGAR
jgi:hypothetical protein